MGEPRNGQGGPQPPGTAISPSITISSPIARMEGDGSNPDPMNILLGHKIQSPSISEILTNGGLAEQNHNALFGDTNQYSMFGVSQGFNSSGFLNSPSPQCLSMSEILNNSGLEEHNHDALFGDNNQSSMFGVSQGFNSSGFLNSSLPQTEGDGFNPDLMTHLLGHKNQCSSISEILTNGGLAEHNHNAVFGNNNQRSMFGVSKGCNSSEFLNSPSAQEHIGMPKQHAQPPVSTSFTPVGVAASSISKYVLPPRVSAMPEFLQQGLNSSSINFDNCSDGSYNWRKYRENQVKDFEFMRMYYQCTQQGCPAMKKVKHSFDGNFTQITYKYNHNHQPLHPSIVTNVSITTTTNSNVQVEHMSGPSERKDVSGHDIQVIKKNDEPNPKIRKIGASLLDPTPSRGNVSESRLVVETISDVDIICDGYKWCKYGQKIIKGNPNPRNYYKCNTPGCNARKYFERAPADPRYVLTKYKGKHNHDMPIAHSG